MRPLFITLLLWPLLLMGDALDVHIIDVGEGQAVLLQRAQRGVLIDTGHAGMAPRVLQRIRDVGVTRLDALYLTHLHPDHASGYFRLHEVFPDVPVFSNCHPLQANTQPDMVRWVDEALHVNPLHQCQQRGHHIDWQGAHLSLLWPEQRPLATHNLNHGSLVLQVAFKQRHVLLMGDADTRAEGRLLELGGLPVADILIAGHHGASDASSERFLHQIKPRQVVISTNRNNLRGYPAPEVVQRLRRYSDQLFTTFDNGNIHLRLR